MKKRESGPYTFAEKSPDVQPNPEDILTPEEVKARIQPGLDAIRGFRDENGARVFESLKDSVAAH